jgi:hypothetical protein
MQPVQACAAHIFQLPSHETVFELLNDNSGGTEREEEEEERRGRASIAVQPL